MSKSRFVESPGNILSSFMPAEEAPYESSGSYEFGDAHEIQDSDIPLVSVNTLASEGLEPNNT